jgi:hypothetical protein
MAFGTKQIVKETPMWAKWMFRTVFVLSGVAVFIVAGDSEIPPATKARIMLYLAGLDRAVFGFSKMFGVEVQKSEEI